MCIFVQVKVSACVCVCVGTGIWVYTECGHSGVFVHEAVCDPAIGALVSIHSMNLQNKRPRRLVLQDRRALSVLLTLRRMRQRAGGRKRRSLQCKYGESTINSPFYRNCKQECVGGGILLILKGQMKDYLLVGQKV